MRKVLIANRGEIAVRIARACRDAGLASVAIYAEPDLDAMHVRVADEAYALGGSTPAESYLSIDKILAVAERSGADAVHPGYGFLAEDPEFAGAVEAAGLVWIGPPPGAMRSGGDKLEAKRIAREAGVPVVDPIDPLRPVFPLLVKAAAGGGGRGMRIVRTPGELQPALEAAAREAEAAFGDGEVFCERYLESGRHVEIQLLADAHGQIVSLGERDCSVQRRYQKLLEESPSPGLDEGVRAAMGDAAIRFARAIGYRNAGTAEFIVAGGEFFFLELNARIQVEHPVTEAVRGRDLVAEQLAIAVGAPLEPAAAPPRGHAIEVRLCAEDPRTFLPQTGRIELLRLPESIRVDSGVMEGDMVGARYDSLLAKLIAFGETRDETLARLGEALAETEVRGVVTNLPFLRWLVRHPVLRAGRATTSFLTRHPPLSPAPLRAPAQVWENGFRLNLPPAPAAAPPDLDDPAHAHTGHTGPAEITAPMPGTVIRVYVAPGDVVEARAPLVALEAMKLELPLVAPLPATVRAVHVSEGETVAAGTVLVELEE